MVLGGLQINHISNQRKLIKSVEIIDIKSKRSYFPISGYKLPEEVIEVVGLFRISQLVKTAEILNLESKRRGSEYAEYRTQNLDQSIMNDTFE